MAAPTDRPSLPMPCQSMWKLQQRGGFRSTAAAPETRHTSGVMLGRRHRLPGECQPRNKAPYGEGFAWSRWTSSLRRGSHMLRWLGAMLTRTWAGFLATVLMLLVAACDGSPNASHPQRERTSTIRGPSAGTSSRAIRPRPGTCWRVNPTDIMNARYWYDDSAQVPCRTRHSSETVSAWSLEHPRPSEAKAFISLCSDEVSRYLGRSPDDQVPVRATL